MAERVKVPLNEPGLVQVTRDDEGRLSSDDGARLSAVYSVLEKEPARVYRLKKARARKVARRAKLAKTE